MVPAAQREQTRDREADDAERDRRAAPQMLGQHEIGEQHDERREARCKRGEHGGPIGVAVRDHQLGNHFALVCIG